VGGDRSFPRPARLAVGVAIGALAGDAAEEGVERARAHGYDASARVEEATEGAGRRIIEVADELDARLIVCGRRGLGTVASALLGSVSHVVLAHAGRPVLIAPEG
jgi:nucleotide-binding universal stress UspA family protein